MTWKVGSMPSDPLALLNGAGNVAGKLNERQQMQALAQKQAAHTASSGDIKYMQSALDGYARMARQTEETGAEHPEVGPHADVFAGAYERALKQMLPIKGSGGSKVSPQEQYPSTEGEGLPTVQVK